jgi:hypothetical protein
MPKVEVPRRSSLGVSALAMIVVCAIVWWASFDSDAQEATPAASRMTADSTLWSLEKPTSNSAPNLVIGMTDRAPYRPLRNAGEEVATPCESIAICKQAASAAFGHRTETGSRALLSGRRWRARALATVRRSNCTCSFPACSFHEDSLSVRCNGRD